MFNEKELNRRDSAYPESQAMPHPRVDPRDEMKYDKAVREGSEITEALLPVREAIKIRRKNALTFEKEQFEKILHNEFVNYADLFMDDITNRMLSAHCGVQTAIQLEIDEIAYILSNFDDYFDEVEQYRSTTPAQEINEEHSAQRQQKVIVRNSHKE